MINKATYGTLRAMCEKQLMIKRAGEEGQISRIQVYSSLIWYQTIKADSATMSRAGVNACIFIGIYIFWTYPVVEIQGRANLCRL